MARTGNLAAGRGVHTLRLSGIRTCIVRKSITMFTGKVSLMKPICGFLAVPLLLLSFASAASARDNNWVDAISLTLGTDEDSSDADIYRLGLQNRWERTWFNGGAWNVGGYWDAEVAYIEADAEPDENDELYDLSLTPVFRMQRDTALSSGVSPFAEAGIGAHLLSETRLASHELSTALQFGSLFGMGLGFGKHGQYELGYRFQHISNANIKTPNEGLSLHMLRLGYSFY
jgi:lipid A 3-O-deacylase